ncbi:ninjurin-1 isoform X1 [Hylobates moloch]|uniref:ninjurin-1 isoform X1 n=1 Tax=Hylobates moloch TaxID=81572 RepID=UPI0013642767|nr:ninjurin-1 isoform X1 [Hylobates moloch]
MDSGTEEYELNGGLPPGTPRSPDALPARWGWRHGPINVNHYANKKSAAESMLDIALLMANASQLKAVVEQGPSFAFYVPLVVLISISLALQIGVGVLLIFLEPWMLPALQLSRPTPGVAIPVRCPPPCTWHSPDCQSPGWPHLHHVPGPALALTVAKHHAGGHSCLSAPVPRRQLPPGTWGLATIAQRVRTGQPQRPVPREGSQPTQGHSRSVDGLDEGPGPASVSGHSRRTRRCLSLSPKAPASPPPVGPVRVALVTPASIHFLTQGPCTARTAFGPADGHWLWS